MNTLIRKITVTLAVVSSCAAIAAGGSFPAKTLKQIDGKIDVLLKNMTLEEKVGQMTQITIDVVSAGADGRLEPHAIDSAKLAAAILRYHVGSIINVGPSGYSVAHWQDVITAIQDMAVKQSRLKIPILYGIDAIHGATYTNGATIFPQSFAVAATWDEEIARGVGEITAYEVRASGIPWNFNPVLDIGRQPLWPRFWETYGEDVFLTRTFGLAYVRGLMGNDMSGKTGVAPCLKHYVGYSFPRTGKDRTPAWIDERMMREYFLPPFEAAVKAGVPTVMANSGDVNGIPGHANYHFLTEVLKEEWGFDGFVDSDWLDIERLFTRDHIATTPKDAVRIAVMAGVDMSMVPLDYSFYDLLLELVKEKSVPLSRIDDAVRRILRVKYVTGLFERPYPDRSLAAGVASPEFSAFNIRAARESITLLRNEGNVLPLSKNRRVLVTGPTADMLSVLNSGWTITWQGDEESLYPKEKPTILKAIRGKLGPKNVVYLPGTGFDAPVGIPAAVAAAETSDVVIACLGEKAYCETAGNVEDLTLDGAQLDLVESLAKTGKPVVVVLAEGRPRIIHRIVNRTKAIVMAYLPGMEGGTAVADILFGDAVPSGKLPFTYPKYPNSLLTYDCKTTETAEGNTYDPEYPFGFGLSYTTFAYSDLAVKSGVATMDDDFTVTVSVRNTGSVAGKEVVQLYVSDLFRSIVPPGRELKAFKKVALAPGETAAVSFTLTPADLSFIDVHNRRVTERGTFRVSVGSLSKEFELR
jgi:beta-glucosidase